jgi:hypothetical protein
MWVAGSDRRRTVDWAAAAWSIRPDLFEVGAVLAAVKDASRRCAAACGHP